MRLRSYITTKGGLTQMHGLHINHTNHILYILTGSSLFLTSGFLALSFLCPFAVDNSYATTETTQNGDYYIETTTTDLNLSINTTPAGAQETASHDVIVKTDDPAGFTLTVSVNNDTSNALNLNGSTSATEKFAATSGTYTSPAALDDNAWGFADTLTKKDNDQWAAVPLLSNAQQLKQTSSASPSGNTTTVYYGINAKYDGKHSNGNYSNTIVYSATGNTIPTPVSPTSINGKTYLQDLVATDCASIPIYDPTDERSQVTTTYILKDKRDNQEYKIRRLYMNTKSSSSTACWMVENLRLTTTSLTANGHSTTLDSSDTNLSANFTLSASDSGAWCTSDYSSCDDKSMMIDAHTSTYPESYLYNWYAATAGTGTYSKSSGNATASICPGKGANTTTWHLPSAGSTSDEWWKLFNAYKSDYGWSTIKGGPGNPTGNNLSTTIGPNFVYSGYREGSSTNSQGTLGSWWSRTANGSYIAHRADLDSDGYVRAGTYSFYKYSGYSVRCVLPAE